MRKLGSFEDSKYFTTILSMINESDKSKFIDWIRSIPDNLKVSRSKIMIKILEANNASEALQLYDKYIKTNSQSQRILITRGLEGLSLTKEKLKNRPKPKNFSIIQKDYWVNRVGLTEEDAQKMVSEIQSKNALARTKDSYKNTKSKLRICLDYWTNLGYSAEEGELLRKQHLVLNDLTSLISRHGEEKGKRVYTERNRKFKESSEKNRHNRKSAGYVSLESKLFFVKLYRVCRKLGISRSEIYVGINGSREFFIRHDGVENRGRFFDFAIPKLHLVVEYNGVFWHPRHESEWKNPWTTFADAMLVEEEKADLCKKRGYDLLTVWSDDDKITSLDILIDMIKEKMNDSRQ